MKRSEEQMGNREFGIVIMAQMFSLAYRLPVEPMARKKDGKVDIVFKVGDDEKDLITSDNYEEIREMIMEQNLIYNPLVAPNKKSQDAIDKAIEKKRSMNSSVETNIESMIVLVSKSREVTEDYTYYQLQADYEMELRLEQSRAIPVYRAVGADIPNIELGEVLGMHEDPYSFDKYRAVGADIPNIELGEVLGMHEDPYSFDKMFKKNDRAKDDLSK